MLFPRRRRYSRGFKIKVIELVKVYGGNPNLIARNVGISSDLMSKWLRKYKLRHIRSYYN